VRVRVSIRYVLAFGVFGAAATACALWIVTAVALGLRSGWLLLVLPAALPVAVYFDYAAFALAYARAKGRRHPRADLVGAVARFLLRDL
jgi:hypothetical protein